MMLLTFDCMRCDRSIEIELSTLEGWRVAHTNRIVACSGCGVKYIANFQIALLRDQTGTKPWQADLLNGGVS